MDTKKERKPGVLDAIEALAKKENKTARELMLSYIKERKSLRSVAKIFACSYQTILLIAEKLEITFPRSSAKEYALDKIKELGYKEISDFFADRPDRKLGDFVNELEVSETTIKRIYDEEVVKALYKNKQ